MQIHYHLSTIYPLHLSIILFLHLFTFHLTLIPLPFIPAFISPQFYFSTLRYLHISPFIYPPFYISTFPPFHLSTLPYLHIFPFHLSTLPYAYITPFIYPPLHTSIFSPFHQSTLPSLHALITIRFHLLTLPSYTLHTTSFSRPFISRHIHLSTLSSFQSSIQILRLPPFHIIY